MRKGTFDKSRWVVLTLHGLLLRREEWGNEDWHRQRLNWLTFMSESLEAECKCAFRGLHPRSNVFNDGNHGHSLSQLIHFIVSIYSSDTTASSVASSSAALPSCGAAFIDIDPRKRSLFSSA